jgi:hypothetical protein
MGKGDLGGFAQPADEGSDKGSDKGSRKGGDKGGAEKGSDKGAEKATGKAKLAKNGDAIAPDGAPRQVVKVIKAANKINEAPYRLGGGHSKNVSKKKGFDCSGAVSYALRGGKFLKQPENSSGLARWGERGKGEWITVYANKGHAYAVIAGLRFDTSGNNGEDGPRWHSDKRSPKSYEARHPRDF